MASWCLGGDLPVAHGGATLHGRAGRGPLHAFTLVELVIVVTVIVLILAVAIPGLSAMGAEARLTAAQQTIQGMTTQAYSLALANRAMTAVRFFPGAWDTIDPGQQRVPGGRQHLAIYSYVLTSAQDDGGNWSIKFGEYFERAKDLSSTSLPEDVWVAPLEALSPNSFGPDNQLWLSGQPYTAVAQPTFNPDDFFDSGRAGSAFLSKEDFLIVCDPQTGIRSGTPTPFQLRTYVPKFYSGSWGYDAYNNGGSPSPIPYQRYSFSGVVTYQREPFMALTGADAPQLRQEYLRESGRPFMVHRFSGGLLPGLQRPTP